MKISYRWLQKYVECGQTPVSELAERLTMAGLEVEGLEERHYEFSERVVVGEVLDVCDHPDSDHLHVCQVNVGEAEPLTIVCGASNVTEAKFVPVALVGAVLPGDFKIKLSKIRGVVSHGMICSEDELGLGGDHDGIIIFSTDLTAIVGTPVSHELFGVEDDTILEIGLTPNRGDCLSHFGVAREVATLLDCSLTSPPIDYLEQGAPITKLASVTIEDTELCPRYAASVITDVRIAPSPMWLKRRVESAGMRSINNVVDVTNFVMMELGQPLHAFDLDSLQGRQIIVRRAEQGEQFTTLDEVERQLDHDMLMIADGQRSVAIAGVMGGLNSEISEKTTTILLESAFFDPSSIRRTSKKLGLSTDASYRFERSINILSVDDALRRATKLIVELTGGTAAKGIIDNFPVPYQADRVRLRFAQVERILGIVIETETIRQILTTLGFHILDRTEEFIELDVPSYRPDITREIDLIEEVGRIYNYDNIPTRFPSGTIPPQIEHPFHSMKRIVQTILLGQGLNEVINYSFMNGDSLEKLGVADEAPYNKVVPLKNPLNVEQNVLRTTTLPGLLGNIHLNTSNRAENIRLFELGHVFFQTDETEPLPSENMMASGILAGSRVDRSWAQTAQPVDFYDLKGTLETLLDAISVSYRFCREDNCPYLHPGEAASIRLKETTIGLLGKVHPDVLKKFDIAQENLYFFELNLTAITKHASLEKHFQSLPRYPAVHRDLALVVAKDVQAIDVKAIIQEVGQPLLEQVLLFDKYVGTQISEGSIGLTYSLRYRSAEKTLTDTEVVEIHQRILKELQNRLAIQLR